MKKRLLKPPQKDGDIIFLPSPEEFFSQLKDESIVGVCHQPYFFNPGISLKFIFLAYLPRGKREIIFLDTDKVKIEVKVSSKEGVKVINFINSEEVLVEYPTPQEELFNNFFSVLEKEIKKAFPDGHYGILSNFSAFRELIFKNRKKKYLKEVLAESFLQFYGIERDYQFLSHLIRNKEFEDFLLRIYKDDISFREIFNQTLDDYKEEFRFRFKNFPFPKLQDNELPFWIVKDGKRIRCFKNDLSLSDFKDFTIFPRASTLTIFLRLYKLDFFIHGVGGANYEWVGNRIIEKFFKETPPLYVVVSGTFLISGLPERQFPYYFFNPKAVENTLRKAITVQGPRS